MDAVNVASLIVAAIAALSALASQRSASRASTANARVAAESEIKKTRLDSETDAYTRAQAIDSVTIHRLDEENKQLRVENVALSGEVRELWHKIRSLERELSKFEGEHQ